MNKIFQFICAGVFLSFFLPVACSTFIDPDQIGIRQGLSGGVVQEDFAQQRILDLPVFHTVHYLPRGVQFQHYLESAKNPLILRTKGNNDIKVDVTVQYRIVEGEAWKLVHEGLQNSWKIKVDSTCQGFLREHLAQFTNEDVQKPERKEEVAASALKPLNLALGQYHVEVLAVNIRAVRFPSKYEGKLQEKQILVVAGELDIAAQAESAAILATDTIEKGIDKDRALETQIWRAQIEAVKTKFEIDIANVDAKAIRYDQDIRAQADATCAKAAATGKLAETEAVALGEKLKAQALATKAGATYAAIIAARSFQLGDIQLNSANPKFLRQFGSVEAWRGFFLPKARRTHQYQ